MLTLRAGLLYFAFVFGAGFVLGTARVLWIVPRFGVRAAEMLEMPLMLSISFISARWIVRRLAIPSQWTARLAMGGVALAVLVAAELTTVLRLRGLSVRDYVHTLDPVTGTVYYVSLGVFGVVPLLVERKERNA